jgi:hypothetical protein
MALLSDTLNPAVTFIEFARLDACSQRELLKDYGILLDIDFHKDVFIHLYFLNGFFIEMSISPENEEEVQIVPFRQGYRLQSYFKQLTVLVPKRQMSREICNLPAYLGNCLN